MQAQRGSVPDLEVLVDTPPRRRREVPPVMVVSAVLLLAAAGVASLALWLGFSDPAPAGSAAAPVTSSAPSSAADGDPAVPDPAAPDAEAPDAEEDAPVDVEQVRGPLAGYAAAKAPTTSANSVDGAGAPISYDASNVLDGDPGTAWRTDGDASGQVLTLALDAPRTITTLGLVNGYAKTDPSTGDDRYAQARQVLRVTWTVGGQEVVQDLRAGERGVQEVSFAPVVATAVGLRIEETTAPGDERFDQTAISEVVLANG